MTQRPRVLLIAEAANPEWVSVPLVGWSMAMAMREVADVHLVTQIRNREAILRAGLVEGEDFTAIDSEKAAVLAHRASTILRMGSGRGWTINTALAGLAYPYFERKVWQAFGPSIRAGDWDVVHRVTPLSPTVSSAIAPKVAAAGVPFVLGPLNGGVPWPKSFNAERSAEREWLSYIRGAYKLKPGRNRTLAAATAILTGSRHTASEIPPRFHEACIYIPENAVDPERFPKTAPQEVTGPLRGIFVGRLVPYKGPDMALEAAAPLLRDGRMRLDIVGDGPLMPRLREIVAREGVEEAVTLHGALPHREVGAVLARSNVLVFPSIREFGGGVVLEAMATGVVPVVIDYAGPGELVTPDFGIKIPLGPRAEIVAALGAELKRLSANRGILPALGARARKRIDEAFTWAAKARQVSEVYAWVVGRRRDKPIFFGKS